MTALSNDATGRTFAVFVGAGCGYVGLAATLDALISSAGAAPAVQVATITILSASAVVAMFAALRLVQAVPTGWWRGVAFVSAMAGALAYSLVYGRYVFTNTFWYDDWSLLDQAWFVPLSVFLTHPLNDHFVPLLNLTVWTTGRLFGLDYIGYACLLHLAAMLAIVGLSLVVTSSMATIAIGVLAIGLYGLWPSVALSRIWFSGGFWLTASTGLMLVLAHYIRARLETSPVVTVCELAAVAVLASATVFISSQTLYPFVFALAFSLPFALSRDMRSRLIKLGMLCAVTLIPSAIAIWGRTVFVGGWSKMDFSGLLDGSLFVNTTFFLFNKVGFVEGYLIQADSVVFSLVLVMFIAVIVAAPLLFLLFGRGSDQHARLVGLLLLGGASLLAAFAQIGVARGWDHGRVLGIYYTALPSAGALCLIAAAIGWLSLLVPDLSSTAVRNRAAVAVAVVIIVLALPASVRRLDLELTQTSAPSNRPGLTSLESQVERGKAQGEFLAAFGQLACTVAREANYSEAIRFKLRSPISDCAECSWFLGPKDYLEALHLTRDFTLYASIVARRRCGSRATEWLEPSRLEDPTIAATDGSDTPLGAAFYEKYFKH